MIKFIIPIASHICWPEVGTLLLKKKIALYVDKKFQHFT